MRSLSSSPFTRDRFPEFAPLRRAVQHQAEWLGESRRKCSATASVSLTEAAVNGSNKNGTRSGVMSPWIRAFTHFLELERTINFKIERLHAQQQAFLQPKFLSDEEEEAQRQEIEGNAQGIQSLLRELERMVISGMRPQDVTNEDEVLASENAKKHLSSRLSMIIQSFREGQELYATQLRRCEDKKQRYKQIGSCEAHERMEREEKIAQYLELGYTQPDIQELIEEDLRQKELSREVQEILRGVTELHAMFKDLGGMVVEQGSILDRIDFNVQQTQLAVGRGVAELKKAREKQGGCLAM
ncbi:putative vesicle-associated membrane protein, putative,syntaxin-like protein [Trypanosoma rangeli]|uniref:Putative vesicle-associated membrane protein, putative,syntaxin-like protein n=1 Tax=Trypanosoma rangeli TaxID=5698 RepID=A0A3R7MIN3_TRYRA|nr:putative vesicle-associated membrane protein, putative,syntaxin-like protein [Trypanosoma rangeli]RNF03205.1 putative vesicle-associated membrane protein, putative,syntaxin-like protein [Trypanosoma rangeli]|eukprot:RNF03205.1 putative vesicle-associated membrane protein, putative,syntaxin-like protein [Trypanosoma rangeli]